MQKRLLKNTELPGLIRTCYESDVDYITKFHETGEKGLDFSINQTVVDFVLGDVKVYALYHNKFVGYFGEEQFNNEKYLTGFWIMPEFRNDHKDDVWKMIKDHFNNEFKAGAYLRNKPATSFLIKNGCKLVEEAVSTFGPGQVFIYKESV